MASSIAASIALCGYVTGEWSSKSSERAPSGASVVTRVGKLQRRQTGLNSGGAPFGFVPVFTALLFRETIPEICNGFLAIIAILGIAARTGFATSVMCGSGDRA